MLCRWSGTGHHLYCRVIVRQNASMEKDKEFFARNFSWNGRILLPPLKPANVAWVLGFYVAALTISTCYLITVNKQASADLAALCTEVRKLPATHAINAPQCP